MFLFETTEISAKTKVLLNIRIPLNLSAVQKFLTIFPCYGQKKLKVVKREQTEFFDKSVLCNIHCVMHLKL